MTTAETPILITTADENGYLRSSNADETIRLGGQENQIHSRGGDDDINSGGGNDLVRSSNGNDTVNGAGGNDSIYGGLGDDLMRGSNGNDYLGGGDGNDRLSGGCGNDRLNGGDGNDRLSGGCDDDRLNGGDGDDFLSGGSGNDRLTGGSGRNRLVGGAGEDVFIFGDDSTGHNIIQDFNEDEDSIVIRDVEFASYTEVKNGTLFTLSNGGEILFKNRFAGDVDFEALFNGETGPAPEPLPYHIVGDATSGTVPVYILAGQSNAVSLNLLNGLLEELGELHEDFVLLRSAANGTILDQVNWGKGDWHPDSEGELYDRMLEQLNETIAAVEARGLTADIEGLFWVQGEADTRTAESSGEYAANLTALFDAFRADVDDDLQFLVSELRTTEDAFTFHQTVRDAQYAVADQNEDVRVIGTQSFDIWDDGVHFNQAGSYQLAAALVDALI